MAIETKANSKSRIPQNSVFFEQIVPIALITMGIVMLGLMLFAAGIVLGIVHF